MLARTHHPMGPWTLVRADDKRLARLNIIKDLPGRLHYKGRDEGLIRPDPRVVFGYDTAFSEGDHPAMQPGGHRAR